jgi:hypothetical protein
VERGLQLQNSYRDEGREIPLILATVAKISLVLFVQMRSALITIFCR